MGKRRRKGPVQPPLLLVLKLAPLRDSPELVVDLPVIILVVVVVILAVVGEHGRVVEPALLAPCHVSEGVAEGPAGLLRVLLLVREGNSGDGLALQRRGRGAAG